MKYLILLLLLMPFVNAETTFCDNQEDCFIMESPEEAVSGRGRYKVVEPIEEVVSIKEKVIPPIYIFLIVCFLMWLFFYNDN